MTQLNLSPEDSETLVTVLESALADLSYEIANTDLQDYRDVLKRKRSVLEKVLRCLNEGMPAER